MVEYEAHAVSLFQRLKLKSTTATTQAVAALLVIFSAGKQKKK